MSMASMASRSLLLWRTSCSSRRSMVHLTTTAASTLRPLSMTSQGCLVRRGPPLVMRNDELGGLLKAVSNRILHSLVDEPIRSHESTMSIRKIKPEDPSFKIARISFDGMVEVVNLKPSELLKSCHIYARDLITLDLTSRQEGIRPRPVRRTISAVYARKKNFMILISFGNTRARVALDGIILFDAHNPAVKEFATEVADIYRAKELNGEPNELVFLEYVLQDTVTSFSRRLRLYEPIVDSFLSKVSNEVYSDTGVHQLVPLKDSLQSFEIHVKQTLECLTQLLNNDDEMLSLLLTEQDAASRAGSKVDFARHEHVELMLGIYARQLNNILLEIHYFLARLKSKQEFVTLVLASYRNRMIRINVHIGIAGLSFGFMTALSGFFGMNLISGFEESKLAFYCIFAGASLGGACSAAFALNYLSGRTMQQRATQRLREIETLTDALSDLCALDHIFKLIAKQGRAVNKKDFQEMLREARQSKHVTEEEIDLLFEIFDRVPDGELSDKDLYVVNSVVRDKSPSVFHS